MSFKDRMTRCPDAFDSTLGAEVGAGFAGEGAEVQRLIAGAAGCSLYLHGLIDKEGEWLRGALEVPEAARDAVLAGLPEIAPDELSPGLRQAKRRLALLSALADLAGVWPLEEVTGCLTRLADGATEAALRAMVAEEDRRRKLPGGPGEDGTGGMVVLAMGKMGAFELNYSSDIDLICFFDSDRYAEDEVQEARAALIRATRRMTALLSEVTSDGYVFRTDLRLRPDASVTPVCISLEAAERYYESFGRTWERAAYIKARPCAGAIAAGERFIDELRPFIWRKHLDFAAIEDAHKMRLLIRQDKGLHGAALEGMNLKLGRGGIREIEFFTQTRQLIAGGRDASLRVRGTVEGLAALVAADWVPAEAAAELTGHYRAHREVEHRLQMIHDAQTHHLPKEREGWDRLAAFMGTDVASLRREIGERMEEVHALTEDFFAPDAAPPAEAPEFGAEVIERWTTYPCLRSERAVAIFERLKPQILSRLGEAAKPEEALLQFDGFLRGLPAGVQLFSLFDANPDLVSLIVDICATAPALAEYLSRNSEVLDAVIGGSFFARWPGAEDLSDRLAMAMARAEDYEGQLDTARRWTKEWHFRIGVHLLRGIVTPEEAGRQYADLAGAVLTALWPVVGAEFARRHGPPPGHGAVVLGMGSLGAGWLTAGSDLDLIVIYDAAGVEASDGRRPLGARPYYAKLTQALVTALSAPMAEGRLYEVDMRLRPSGKQGPVATALSAFAEYQRGQAWTWEHLALTRARPIAAVGAEGPALMEEIEALRREILAEKADGATVREDTAAMRARLAEAKDAAGPWDAKAGPGRLSDIELMTACAALQVASPARDPLEQLTAAVAAGYIGETEKTVLAETIAMFRAVQATARLLAAGPVDAEALGEGGRRLMLERTGAADMDALAEDMARAAAEADALIAARLEEE